MFTFIPEGVNNNSDMVKIPTIRTPTGFQTPTDSNQEDAMCHALVVVSVLLM